MNNEEIFTKVVGILKPYAKNEEALAVATLESNILKDLKVNSARLVDVVLEFEDDFNIEIADKEADQVEFISDAVTLIADKLS